MLKEQTRKLRSMPLTTAWLSHSTLQGDVIPLAFAPGFIHAAGDLKKQLCQDTFTRKRKRPPTSVNIATDGVALATVPRSWSMAAISSVEVDV